MFACVISFSSHREHCYHCYYYYSHFFHKLLRERFTNMHKTSQLSAGPGRTQTDGCSIVLQARTKERNLDNDSSSVSSSLISASACPCINWEKNGLNYTGVNCVRNWNVSLLSTWPPTHVLRKILLLCAPLPPSLHFAFFSPPQVGKLILQWSKAKKNKIIVRKACLLVPKMANDLSLITA